MSTCGPSAGRVCGGPAASRAAVSISMSVEFLMATPEYMVVSTMGVPSESTVGGVASGSPADAPEGWGLGMMEA